MTKTNKIIAVFICAIMLVTFAACRGNDINPNMSADPSANNSGSPFPIVPIDNFDGGDEKDPIATPLPYSRYRSMNSDVCGWITIDDTIINYPIAQGKDNDYYLYHDAAKDTSKQGCIFVDYECKVPDGRSIVMFGHNMKNGTMFANLINYTDKEFYNAHRVFYIYFGDTRYTYKVVSVYTVDGGNPKFMRVDFANDDEFAAYQNDMMSLSMYPVDTEIKPTDKMVTLVTCNRANYQNGRLAVHAVLIEKENCDTSSLGNAK